MKKLMLAAAIVCAAAMVKAATANWTYESNTLYSGYKASSIGGYYIGGNEGGSTAYLVYYGGGSATGITQADLLSALRDGSTMADMSAYVLKTAEVGTNGKIAQTASFAVDTTKMYESGGVNYLKAYTVIVNGDNVLLTAETANTYDGNNEIGHSNPTSTGSMYLRDNDGSKSFSNAGWYSTVPEPTSGLLLLLGMAGLALRRRRA